MGRSANGLVIVEAELAAALAKFWRAIEDANSGAIDFPTMLARMPEPYRSGAVDIVADMDDDADDSDKVDVVYDSAIEGDWVEWLEQEMLTLVPPPVVAEFGKVSFSGASGPCLLIDEAARPAVVAALRQWGFEVVDDDAAVSDARPR